MARTKIDYGIDLGTTNSSIAQMKNGTSVIKKNEYQMDTTASCVHFNKKGTRQVGQKAYNNLGSERRKAFTKNNPSLINAFEEFKRIIGTDVEVKCENMGQSFTPEELSAEVLKKLKGYIPDEDINATVITVPAKFQGYQKDATQKAAELAGFQYCILIHEPVAASMAYGIDGKSIDGLWVVFDFGGGTFDAALMKAEEGIMKVIDTEGDNFLGGKNIDYAVVDNIIIPYLQKEYSIEKILSDEYRKTLLRNGLKQLAEEIKIALSSKIKIDIVPDEPVGEDDDGNEIEIDISVTKEEYEKVVKPIFQRAIDITKKLLSHNNLSGSDLETVLMIGGPTFSQTLRDMLREQITDKINVSIDPMTAVATGAALFASTMDLPESIRKIDKTKIQLTLKYPETTVETEESLGIRIDQDKTTGEFPEKLFVEVIRQDKGWSSGKVEIKGGAEVLSIVLLEGKSNGFQLVITDDKGAVYPAEPDSFSIIHGFKVAGPTLPFDLCIDAYEVSKERQHLIAFDGLQKNQPIPAKGTATFRTQEDLRPGNANDIIRIPLYYGKKGAKSIYSELRGEVVISGDMLPGFLPKGSEVEINVEIDQQEMIKVSVSFPYLDDEVVEVTLPGNKKITPPKETLVRELEKVSRLLGMIKKDCPGSGLAEVKQIQDDLNDLDSLLAKGGGDSDTRLQVHARIQEISRKIDDLQKAVDIPKTMQELNESLGRLKESNEQYGDEKSSQMVKKISEHAKTVIDKQDSRMAKELIEQINILGFSIVDKGAGVALEIGMIKEFDDKFEMFEWKDRSRARQLINEAKNIIISNRATKAILKPIVGEIYSLLPPADKPIGQERDKSGLIK